MTVPPDVDIQRKLTSAHIDEWLQDDVFKLKWWFLLFLLILTFYIWWKLLDKKRRPEIVLYAALTMILVMAQIEYGQELTLWDYPTDIIPIFPPLTSLNLLSLPLIYSLIYQFFPTKNGFVLAVLTATAFICFIMEPLMVWGGLYQLLNWKYYLSYPFYAITAFIIRPVVKRIRSITKNS